MVIALGAGYAETCKSGSGGGSAETAAETQYGAAVWRGGAYLTPFTVP